MRISDWSSDVCSSDLPNPLRAKLDGLPTGGDEFRRQVEDMRSQIGRLRLKAAAFRIAFVAAQMETIRQDAGEAGLMLLGSLLVSAEDMRGRLSGLQEHDGELALCDRLNEAVQPRQSGRAGVREKVCQYGEV